MKIRKKEIAKEKLEKFEEILERMFLNPINALVSMPISFFILTVVLTPIITIFFINTTEMHIMMAIICSAFVAFVCSIPMLLFLLTLLELIISIIKKLFFKDDK